MYLVDTNVFLEVLLAQEKRAVCKRFLDAHIGQLYISDFSLHSIGVILFRQNKEAVFQQFIGDVLQKVGILSLSKGAYRNLVMLKDALHLDFDDAYQYKVAEENNLTLVTMDQDFKTVGKKVQITFL